MLFAPSSRRSARRAVLVASVSTLLAVSALPAVSVGPANAAAADGAGYVDFSYGTVTDDVTAHTSQSKLWFHDGAWWAVMMEPAETTPVAHENRWAIFRLDVPSQTWISTKVQVDERNQSHPDVLSSGDQIYVASSYSRSETEAVKVYKYNYDAASKTYVLDPLFVDADPRVDRPGRFDDGRETPARGIQYATIARAGDRLVIAYTSANDVWYMTSDLQALNWSSPTPLLTGAMAPISGPPGPTTASSDDIATVVSFGADQLGIMWSRTSTTEASYGGFFFSVWNGSSFGAPEVAWDGTSVGDNHISVKAASDGRVLVAIKTSLKGTDDPLVSVLERGSGGGWSQHTVITRQAGGVPQDATRPVLVLDSDQAHVVMTDRVDGGAVYRNSAPLSSLTFSNGLGAAFIKDSAYPNTNDATSTKQQVSASAGIVVLASDDVDGRDRYLHGCTAASCPAGGVVLPPPAAATVTSTTLTASPNPSVAGAPVTLTAKVSGGADIGGSVTFFDGDTQIKTVALTDNSASTTTTTLSTGQHTLKAVYSGNVSYQPSTSASVTQTVLAATATAQPATGGSTGGSTSGTGGAVTTPPIASRLQIVAPPRRVLSARRVGANKVVAVTLPAPTGVRAMAVNVTVVAGTKTTTVAVCSGGQTKAACKAKKLMKVSAGTRKAAFTLQPLSGPKVKLFNSSGRARFTLDVQGWYVNDASKARFSALSPVRRVLKSKKVGSGKSYLLQIPAVLRPSGTVAVELGVSASAATRKSSVAACRAVSTKSGCLARPTLFAKPGSTVVNRVIVPVRANGKVKLVNGSGSVRLTVFVRGVYTLD